MSKQVQCIFSRLIELPLSTRLSQVNAVLYQLASSKPSSTSAGSANTKAFLANAHADTTAIAQNQTSGHDNWDV
jgi:hypothetical protein